MQEIENLPFKALNRLEDMADNQRKGSHWVLLFENEIFSIAIFERQAGCDFFAQKEEQHLRQPSRKKQQNWQQIGVESMKYEGSIDSKTQIPLYETQHLRNEASAGTKTLFL